MKLEHKQKQKIQIQNKRVDTPSRIEDWLDQFPPSKAILEEKEQDHSTPKSEGRSIWFKRSHQDSIDLHGLKAKEVARTLSQFIHGMRERGLRKGLIIHGKGLHSKKDPVLATIVREYLEQSKEIGEFGGANRFNGGSGATWFLLRQRSR